MIDAMLPPLAEEPRLNEAIELFNRGEFEKASDIMEELFFEAIGEERTIARVLLQVFVGMVHVDQRQTAPAIERLRVGIEAADLVSDWMGIDGKTLASEITLVVRHLERGEPAPRITVKRSPVAG